MGCCSSCNSKTDLDQEKVNERSSLLRNEVGPSPSRPISDDGTKSTTSISKTDEQSMLSRILHKTANDIIDVSAIEPHSIERTEYMERIMHYHDKTTNAEFHPPKPKVSPVGLANPASVLSSDPISSADIQLIIESCKNAATAVNSMDIVAKEPLVVDFGVQQVVAVS